MGLETYLKAIELIVNILPMLEKIVNFIEAIFNKFKIKNPTLKKELAIAVANKQYPNELDNQALGDTIDIIVDMKNRSGEFSHSGIEEPRPDNN